MDCGHVLTIEPTYDTKREVWTAKIALREYRGGAQYGGDVTIDFTAAKGAEYSRAMKQAVADAKSLLDLVP